VYQSETEKKDDRSYLKLMPPDEPKYFNRIKFEKNVQRI
jgi:hypothetical protein